MARIVASSVQNFWRNTKLLSEQIAPNKNHLTPTNEASFMQTEDLIQLVTKTMPFGKYEGRILADLPGHYLGWFAREGFPRGEIGRLLEIMYEIDHNNLRDLLTPLRSR